MIFFARYVRLFWLLIVTHTSNSGRGLVRSAAQLQLRSESFASDAVAACPHLCEWITECLNVFPELELFWVFLCEFFFRFFFVFVVIFYISSPGGINKSAGQLANDDRLENTSSWAGGGLSRFLKKSVFITDYYLLSINKQLIISTNILNKQ